MAVSVILGSEDNSNQSARLSIAILVKTRGFHDTVLSSTSTEMKTMSISCCQDVDGVFMYLRL